MRSLYSSLSTLGYQCFVRSKHNVPLVDHFPLA